MNLIEYLLNMKSEKINTKESFLEECDATCDDKKTYDDESNFITEDDVESFDIFGE